MKNGLFFRYLFGRESERKILCENLFVSNILIFSCIPDDTQMLIWPKIFVFDKNEVQIQILR